MSTTFFINEMFTVSQNVQLYSQNVAVTNASIYDYVLEVDIAAGSWNSMNHLFATRSVIQNSAIENTNGENTYDVNLTLNVDATRNLLFGSDAIGIKSDMANVTNKNAYVTLLPSKKLIGLRLLEVLATKIFGHAQARSAISNDSAFYSNGSNSLIAQIASGINNGLVAKRNNIFNEYVQTGRIVTQANTANNGSSELVNGDDVQDNETMNFHSSNWEFPVTLNGSLLSAANANDLSVLNNGPDVGGSRLVNGMYSVPLLVRFYASGAAAAAAPAVPAGTQVLGDWIQFDLGSAKVIQTYGLGNWGADKEIGSWTLAGSTDNSTWYTIDTQTQVTPNHYSFSAYTSAGASAASSFRYIRLIIQGLLQQPYINGSAFQFTFYLRDSAGNFLQTSTTNTATYSQNLGNTTGYFYISSSASDTYPNSIGDGPSQPGYYYATNNTYTGTVSTTITSA